MTGLGRSKIEWARNPDGTAAYNWSPISGCRNGCEYCWARRMVARFPGTYPDGFEPTIHRNKLSDVLMVPGKGTVLTCIMGDLFSPGVIQEWQDQVAEEMRTWPEPTYLLLTKRPDRVPPLLFAHLLAFSDIPNLWLGVSVESQEHVGRIADLLRVDVAHRFVSLEPLLGPVDVRRYIEGLVMPPVEWLIIGALTGPGAKPPKLEWVNSIIDAADRAQLAVFCKDNLLAHYPHLNIPRLRMLPYLSEPSSGA